MEIRVWQPASVRARNNIQRPVPYYLVIGHCDGSDKWMILECNLLSWNDSMQYSILSVIHNTDSPPMSHEYEAGIGLTDGLHIITRRTISTGFNGITGVVINAYRNSFYVIDLQGRVGRAGSWPKLGPGGWTLSPRMADRPIAHSSDYGWILEVTSSCPRHAALLGFHTEPPSTKKLYKFLRRERNYWMWLSGANALFSDNWEDPQVDTTGGYRLYSVDTVTGHETPYVYTGPAAFHIRVLTWDAYHEELIKYDVMNGKIVMVTRIRDCHDNSKYRVYYIDLDHVKLTFSTRMRITIPYGDYYASTLDLSFSVDADKFCAKDHTPGLNSRLMFYSLSTPTLRAVSYQAVARQRMAYNWFWVLGRLPAWLGELFRW